MSKFRRLRIHSKHRGSSWNTITVPEIRLEGKWLAELGFEVGQYVQVEVSQHKLVITLKKCSGEK